MHDTHPTLVQRRALCSADVTLNGRRAKISGAHREFAKVSDFQAGLSAEWAWATVARVVANGGSFQS